MNALRSPLALVFLLASACGDDENEGAGGEGGATSSTAQTTTSAASNTTSSSSPGGAGPGGSGQGGSGQGGSGQGGSGGEASSGSAGGASACDLVAGEGAAVVVVTVDEEGNEVPALRVAWQIHPADAFWLSPEEATCAEGEPPCSVWVIDQAPTERISITAERTTEAIATEVCLPYASTFVTVHPSDGGARQLVHLTLPTYGTYCIDPESGQSVVNVEHDEDIGDDDCLAGPRPASGPIVLSVVDLASEPVPGSIAHWYYPPKSPAFDGEHPMACADPRCSTWVAEEAPKAGPIYLNVSYAGPLDPFVQQGWSSYGAGPFEVEVDDGGRMIPIAATLEVDTTLEGAIGG